MAEDRYRVGNLQSWMTPQQYAQYRALNQEFRSAYGNSFGDFDYFDYLTNPEVARNIDYFANTARTDKDWKDYALGGGVVGILSGNDPSKQSVMNQQRRAAALANIKSFFEGIGQDPGLIDPTPYFDKAKGEIGALADQQRMQVRGDVNRAFAGAQERVSESLAGSGMGRSGAAVAEFSNAATQQATAEVEGLNQVEAARLATEQKLVFDQMQFELDQELLDQGWDRELRRDALNFMKQMQLMNFQAALQYEPSSWLETFGSLVQIGAQIYGITQGIPPVGAPSSAPGSSGVPGGFYGTNAY